MQHSRSRIRPWATSDTFMAALAAILLQRPHKAGYDYRTETSFCCSCKCKIHLLRLLAGLHSPPSLSVVFLALPSVSCRTSRIIKRHVFHDHAQVLSTKRSHSGVGFGTGNRPELLVQSTADVGPGEYSIPGATGERQARRNQRYRRGRNGDRLVSDVC